MEGTLVVVVVFFVVVGGVIALVDIHGNVNPGVVPLVVEEALLVTLWVVPAVVVIGVLAVVRAFVEDVLTPVINKAIGDRRLRPRFLHYGAATWRTMVNRVANTRLCETDLARGFFCVKVRRLVADLVADLSADLSKTWF